MLPVAGVRVSVRTCLGGGGTPSSHYLEVPGGL